MEDTYVRGYITYGLSNCCGNRFIEFDIVKKKRKKWYKEFCECYIDDLCTCGIILNPERTKMEPHFIWIKKKSFEVPDICGKGGNKDGNQNTHKITLNLRVQKKRKNKKNQELVPSRLDQFWTGCYSSRSYSLGFYYLSPFQRINRRRDRNSYSDRPIYHWSSDSVHRLYK